MKRAFLLAATLLGLTVAADADNWPQFRGPTGLGLCTEKDLPVTWSTTENVRWKTPLPGPGNSSPVVWGNRVFITQAQDKGQRRSTICFDRKDGKLLWQKEVEYKEKETTHNTNPYCSASPATDGERVVVSHGSAGVFCYDFEGKELWRRDLGKFEHIWGNAASPIIYGDLVILNCGPGDRQFLLAMNKKDGKDVWKIDEPGGKLGDKGRSEWIGSWSTPVLAKIDGQDQLIMSWPGVVKAHDPKTGEVIWWCKGLERENQSDRLTYTSPLATSEAVVAMAGFGGPAIGLKPGGKGDITETARLWRHPSNPQRIGSGVILGDHIYMVNEPGTAQCIELKTGKTLWTERATTSTWASLVHADGKLYVTSRMGETIVLAAKPQYELIGKNRLNEDTYASIAVSDGELFIRTYENLWCIGGKK